MRERVVEKTALCTYIAGPGALPFSCARGLFERALRVVAWAAVFWLGFALLGRLAWAAPEVRAELDGPVVAVGDSVRLSLQASAEDVDVDSPDPDVPPSVRVQLSSTGPLRSISIVNGVRTDRRGLRATWVLVPTQVGRYRLTPSVSIGGKRVHGNAVELQVVKPGQVPSTPQGQAQGGRKGQPRRRDASPFDQLLNPLQDPFGDPFPDPFSGQDPFKGLFDRMQEPAAPEPQTSPDLAMVQAPRGKVAFLHAAVDKTTAVVGEQVTYSVYLYVDAEQSEPRYDDVHEASPSDFLRQPIMPDDKGPEFLGHTTVGGHVWAVKLLRRAALFPLRPGHLSIAPMTLRISNGRVQGATRETEPIAVDVTDPPTQGRPQGYVIGNVGRFKLTANVTPREVDLGGVLTVEVELAGTGNLPSTLTPPPRRALEWLPPDVKSFIEPDPKGRIGGRRLFTYVVRARETGPVEMGELSLPFFDPDSGKFDVAKAALGTVTVNAVAGAAGTQGAASSQNAAATSVLDGLPKALSSPEPADSNSASFVTRPSFLVAWLGAPLAALLFMAGSLVRRGLKRRAAAPRDNPKARLRGLLREAEDALAKRDAKAADAAVVRYVEASIQTRTALSPRGVSLDRLSGELVARRVSDDVAGELTRVLREAEVARFAPGGVELSEVEARFNSAKRAVDRLPDPPKSESRGRAGASLVILLALGSLLARDARADEPSKSDVTAAAEALDQGKPEVAIALLESLADRGVVDAHASFDRGLAYAERVRLGGGQPGDLGLAVHGFEEARRLSSEASVRRDAERAIQTVRTEIARRQADREAVELDSRTLADSISGLMDASGWAFFACATSLILALALLAAFRFRGEESSVGRRLLTSALLVAGISAPLSLASAALAHERANGRHQTWAVVLNGEVRASVNTGSGPAGTGTLRQALPEGAIVEVIGDQGGHVEVRWGGQSAVVPRRTVRMLATRS